jgi:hypothetical protein
MAIDSFAPSTRVATDVPSEETILRVVKGTPNVHEYRFSFDVTDQDGDILRVHSGDLKPHATGWVLTAGQKTALSNCTTVADVFALIQNFLLTKARGTLPTP